GNNKTDILTTPAKVPPPRPLHVFTCPKLKNGFGFPAPAFAILPLAVSPSPGTNPTGGNPMAHVAARRTLLIAALLIVSYGPYAPALAENDTPSKPQISVETKYVEISLTVDSEL